MELPDDINRILRTAKIYHILHIDRLRSVINSDGLLSDALMQGEDNGTVIGMSHIKSRRLNELMLRSHQGLYVGRCVPFYFCPRSVMLYFIFCRNHSDLTYTEGQDPVIHLESRLSRAIRWADRNNLRWAFTFSNAGSRSFDDAADIRRLTEIDWDAVNAKYWQDPYVKEKKQAEFLVEDRFHWRLIERIGVNTKEVRERALDILEKAKHQPDVEILQRWYY
jgi:hypothetical protein